MRHRTYNVVDAGDAEVIGLFSDEERASVFGYILSHLAVYDEEIAPAVGLPHARVIAILDLLRQHDLVTIGSSLHRDARVVEVTERGARIARALRNISRRR